MFSAGKQGGGKKHVLLIQVPALTSDLNRPGVCRRQENCHICHQTLKMGYYWSSPSPGGGGGHRLSQHRVKWLVEGVVV